MGILCFFLALYGVSRAKGDTVSLSCGHVIDSPVNVLTLATSATYNVSQYAVNVTATSPSNVFIRSTCCANMTLTGAQCSRVCTPFGLKMCRLLTTESLVLNLDLCLYTEYVNVSCVVTETKTMTTTDMTSSTSLKQTVLQSTTTTAFSTTLDGALVTSSAELTNMTGDGITTSADSNNTTTVPVFDEEAAAHDMYTFLIVAGAIVLLVAVLVVGFFLRKRREKGSISRGDCALNFWHNHSDHVVEKRYCPSSTSFTFNPVYSSGKTASDTSSHRYRHRDDQEACPRNDDRDVIGHENDDVGRNFNSVDMSNVEYSIPDTKCKNSNRPSCKENKYAEKYVATAAGSNFYSYRQTPEVEPSTNLDDDIDCLDYDAAGSRQMYSHTEGSTFKPVPSAGGKETKRKRRGDRRQMENAGSNGGERTHADGYKDRLRKRLDDWSAEESDV